MARAARAAGDPPRFEALARVPIDAPWEAERVRELDALTLEEWSEAGERAASEVLATGAQNT